MKFLLKLVCAALVFIACGANAQTCASLAKQWQAIFLSENQSLWILPAKNEETNFANLGFNSQVVLAIDGDNTWLIGSTAMPSTGRRLACSVGQRFKRKISQVIQTRPHPEAVMGTAGVLVTNPAAGVWALQEVRESMRALCPVCIDRFNARLQSPASKLKHGLRLGDVVLANRPLIPGEKLGPFNAFAFERQQASSTLVLHHEASNTWLAPGLLWNGDVPDTRETDPTTMVKSLRLLLAQTNGQAKFVPEQGPLANTNDFLTQLAYWEWLEVTVKKSIEQGGNMPTKASDLPYPSFERFKHYALRHALNLQRTWRLSE